MSLQSSVCCLLVTLFMLLIHVQASRIVKDGVYNSANTNGETRARSTKPRKECTTQECMKAASLVKSAMNLSADPCTDFYQYVCGGWIQNNPIPSGTPYIVTFTKLTDEINKSILKRKLETGINNIPGASTQLMRIPSDVYQSCMSLATIDNVADGPLRQLIQDLGTWSMTGRWNENNWNFVNAIATIHREYTSASGPLFSVQVIVNAHHNDEYIIKIDEAGPKKATNKYRNAKFLAAYKKYIEDVVKLLGGTNNAVVSQKAQKIIDFETKLAGITIPPHAKLLYHRMSINELQRDAPQFDWLNHLNRVLAPKTVLGSEMIEVPTLLYLKKCMELVRNESKSVLANYLVWYVIQDEMSFMSEPYRNASMLYKRSTSGIRGQEERWKACMKYANSRDFVGDIIGASYVRDNYTKVVRNQNMIKGITNDIRKAFKENVKSLTWLDDTTKNTVYDKLDVMRNEVGFPYYFANTTSFTSKFSKYDNVITSNTNFHQNMIAITKAKNNARLGNFKTTADKREWWFTKPQYAGAFYLRKSNTIFLTDGIIRPPFVYKSDSLKALNFGALGFFIAHEITHGFDNVGSKFNKEGEISSQWWTNSSLHNFKAKIQCIIDQYSRYLLLGLYPLKARGRHLGENIADNGGFKAALKAYFNWSNKNVNDLWLLPGLNFTNEQLFYIGFGQTLCYHGTDEYRISFLNKITEPEFRVKGTLSNSVEFANAFNCQPNSPMNPTTKCSIWSTQ